MLSQLIRCPFVCRCVD